MSCRVSRSHRCLSRLDRVCVHRDIATSTEKSQHCSVHQAFWIAFHRGMSLLLRGQRVCDLLFAIVDLLDGAIVFPRKLSSFGISIPFHNLHNRPIFVVFMISMPSSGAKTTLLVLTCLSAWSLTWLSTCFFSGALDVRMASLPSCRRRRWFLQLQMLLCVLFPSPYRELVRHASDKHDMVRLTVESCDMVAKSRLGAELRRPLRTDDFHSFYMCGPKLLTTQVACIRPPSSTECCT